ncbi:MAG: nucleotidyltransferase [Polyangiaceae bacterium]
MDESCSPEVRERPALEFYRQGLQVLDRAGVQYLIGGGYAMRHYAGIHRPTKDLDLFVRPGESRFALDTLGSAGHRIEWPWPHFLGRAVSGGDAFIDVLYNSANGLTEVDDEWFEYSTEAELFGRVVRFVPVEEMLWSRCSVQERERFDGADVAHLLLRCGSSLDWQRLLKRCQGHDAMLLGHLIFFDYIYPTERCVPDWVGEELTRRIRIKAPPTERICRGPNLAPHQYRTDIENWGFIDARRRPHGPLRLDEIARITPADAQPIR